ncbi:unnamed protein product [Cunninghamella blakesleeana]
MIPYTSLGKLVVITTLDLCLRFNIEFFGDQTAFCNAILNMISIFQHLDHLKYVSGSGELWMARRLLVWAVIILLDELEDNDDGDDDYDDIVVNNSNNINSNNGDDFYKDKIERLFTVFNAMRILMTHSILINGQDFFLMDLEKLGLHYLKIYFTFINFIRNIFSFHPHRSTTTTTINIKHQITTFVFQKTIVIKDITYEHPELDTADYTVTRLTVNGLQFNKTFTI